MWSSFLNEVQTVLTSSLQPETANQEPTSQSEDVDISSLDIDDEGTGLNKNQDEFQLNAPAIVITEDIASFTNESHQSSKSAYRQPREYEDAQKHPSPFLLAELQQTLPSIILSHSMDNLALPPLDEAGHERPDTGNKREGARSDVLSHLVGNSSDLTLPELGKTPTYSSPLLLRRAMSQGSGPSFFIPGMLGMRSSGSNGSHISRSNTTEEMDSVVLEQPETRDDFTIDSGSLSHSSSFGSLNRELHQEKAVDLESIISTSESSPFVTAIQEFEEGPLNDTAEEQDGPTAEYMDDETPEEEGPILEEAEINPNMAFYTGVSVELCEAKPTPLYRECTPEAPFQNTSGSVTDKEMTTLSYDDSQETSRLRESQVTLSDRQDHFQDEISNQSLLLLKLRAQMEQMRLEWENNVEDAVAERLGPIQTKLADAETRHEKLELALTDSKSQVISLSCQLKQLESKDEKVDQLIESLERTLIHLKRENEEQGAICEDLQQKLEEKSIVIEKMEKNHQDSLQHLQQSHDLEIKILHERLDSSDYELQKSQSFIQDITLKFQDFMNTIMNHSFEMNDSTNQSDFVQTFSDGLVLIRDQWQDKDKKNSQLEEIIQRLLDEIKQEKQQLQEHNIVFELQIQDLQRKLESAPTEESIALQLEQEKSRWQKEADEIRLDLEQQIQHLQTELESVPTPESINERIDQERSQWQKEADQVQTDLQKLIATLEGEKTNLEQAKLLLEQDYALIIEKREQDLQSHAEREQIFTQKSQEWKEKVEKMKSALNTTKKELKSTSHLVSELEKENETIKGEFHLYRNTSEQQSESYQGQIEDLERQIRVAKDEMDAKETKHVNELEILQSINDELKATLDLTKTQSDHIAREATKQINHLRKEIVALKMASSSGQTVIRENIETIRRDVLQEVAFYEQEMQRRVSEGIQLRASLASMMDDKQQLQTLCQELNASLEEKSSSLQETKEDVENLSNQLERALSDLEQSENEKQDLEIAVETLQSTSSTTITQLNETIIQLEQEISQSNAYVQEIESWKKITQDAVVQFMLLSRSHISELEEAYTQSQTQLQDSQCQIKSLETHMQHAVGQISVLEQSIQSSTWTLQASMETKEETWISNMTQLLTQKLHAEETCRRTEQTCSQLETLYSDSQKEVQMLQKERQDLVEKIKSYREQRDSIAAERDSLSEQIHWSSQLQQILESIKSSPYLHGTIAERTDTLLRRTQDTSVRSQYEDLKSQYATCIQELEQARDAFLSLKKAYDVVIEERGMLQQTLDQYKTVTQEELKKLSSDYIIATSQVDLQTEGHNKAKQSIAQLESRITGLESEILRCKDERDDAISALESMKEMSTIVNELAVSEKDTSIQPEQVLNEEPGPRPPSPPPKQMDLVRPKTGNPVTLETISSVIEHHKSLYDALEQSMSSFSSTSPLASLSSKGQHQQQKSPKKLIRNAIKKMIPSIQAVNSLKSTRPSLSSANHTNIPHSGDTGAFRSSPNPTVHLAVVQDEARIQDLWTGLSDLLQKLKSSSTSDSVPGVVASAVSPSMLSVSSASSMSAISTSSRLNPNTCANPTTAIHTVEATLLTIFEHFQVQHKQLQDMAHLLTHEHEAQSVLVQENERLSSLLRQYQHTIRDAEDQLRRSGAILKMHQGVLSAANGKLTMTIDFFSRAFELLQKVDGLNGPSSEGDTIQDLLRETNSPQQTIPMIPTAVNGDISVWSPCYSYILKVLDFLIQSIRDRDAFVQEHASWMNTIKHEHIKSVHEVESALLERNRLVHIQMETLKRMQQFSLNRSKQNGKSDHNGDDDSEDTSSPPLNRIMKKNASGESFGGSLPRKPVVGISFHNDKNVPHGK